MPGLLRDALEPLVAAKSFALGFRQETTNAVATVNSQLLALAPAPADGERPNLFVQFVPFILIFVVFYFLVFAPMRRKQRTHSEMLSNLKPGDRVITSGGIHGTVVGVNDHVVQVRIADQVKVEVTKSAVTALQQSED